MGARTSPLTLALAVAALLGAQSLPAGAGLAGAGVIAEPARVPDELPRRQDSEQPWPLLLDFGDLEHAVGADCRAEAALLRKEFNRGTLWAVEMWEASAHAPTAWLSGGLHQLGAYDECLQVAGPVAPQYCLATLDVDGRPKPLPVNGTESGNPRDPNMLAVDTLRVSLHSGGVSVSVSGGRSRSRWSPYGVRLNYARWALCAPASCAPDDLVRGLSARLPPWARPSLHPDHCTKSTWTPPIDAADIAFGVCCVVLFLLVLVSTTVHLSCGDAVTLHKSWWWKLVGSFSADRSVREMVSPPPAGPRGLQLGYLDGMRAVTIYIIVADHHYLNMEQGAVMNNLHLIALSKNVFNAAATMGEAWVDTYFLIGGFLFALKELDKPSDTIKALLLRYLRLTPSYAMVVWFYASVYDNLGSGPLWREAVGLQAESCRQTWWTNMLYINNYVPTHLICAIQTWYLAADFQLCLLSLVVFLPLLRHWPRLGLASLATASVASVAYMVGVTVAVEYPPVLISTPEFMRTPHRDEYFRRVYVRTENRATPYLLGIALAYCVLAAHAHRGRGRSGAAADPLSKVTRSAARVVLVCVLGFALCWAVLSWGTVFYLYDHAPAPAPAPVPVAMVVAYASLRRILWVTGVGACIVVLTFSENTPLHRVLQWGPVRLVGRLSYGIYLVHIAIQIALTASRRAPATISGSLCITDAITDFGLSCVCSAVLFVAVESPFRRVAKIVLSESKRSSCLNENAVRLGPAPAYQEEPKVDMAKNKSETSPC